MTYNKASRTLYASLATAKRILIFNTMSNTATDQIQLDIYPTGIALSKDGKTLYVAGGSQNGKLITIDLKTKRTIKSISLGHTPEDVEVCPEGKRIYVANRFSNNVSVIDIDKMSEIKRIKVAREPKAITISKDGKSVFVANFLPSDMTDGTYASAKISVINTSILEVTKEVELPNGSTALNDIAVSPDGEYVYVTHILSRYQLPTTQLERGWMNTNALSVLETGKTKYYATILLDDVENGAANPWGISFSNDGKKMFVVLSGTDEICIINREGLHLKLKKREDLLDGNKQNVRISDDIGFASEFKNRYKLNGKGFRNIIADEEYIFLPSYFSDSISRYNYISGNLESYKLPGGSSEISLERKGEILFHDATISFQGWQSCSSCHPGDARADGLNWDLLNDGIGNPRNTKSLLLAHQTPPSMISGVRINAETAVRAGIKHSLFSVRPDEDANAIDAYLKRLTPVPSPFLIKNKLSKKAEKGSKIFEKAKCTQCHSGPYYTNMKSYDVGTANEEKEILFDTPSLVEIWRTAPYLNDGRAATIKETFTRFNINDKHGITSDLSEGEMDCLVEYVSSL
jgi:YVTN family beta-propeller protein